MSIATRFLKIAAIALAGWAFLSTGFAAEVASPEGHWTTIDDETGKPRSIVKIWQEQGKLFGKIEKIYLRKDERSDDLCVKCTGQWQNKPILGMTIMWGLVQQKDEPNKWAEGRILDPNNGKIYRCQLTVDPDGKKLNVRGFIGMPLLGRTQTWIRDTNTEQEQEQE